MIGSVAHKILPGPEFCTAEQHTAPKPLPPLAGTSALERGARLFRALGEVSRLRLLARLARGEMCVTDIAVAENEDISTISQRLRVLRAENIVVRNRRGKHINYALADQHIANLVADVLEHASEPQRNEKED